MNLRTFIFAPATILVMGLAVLPTGLYGAPVQAQTPAAPATVSLQYVVKLHDDSPAVLQSVGSAVERKFAFSQDPAFQNVYSFASPAPLSYLRQELAGYYDYLEIDQPVITKLDSAVVPVSQGLSTNDPGFTDNPANIDRQWALPKAGFTRAWRSTTGSARVVVAVIDTGFDATHEDLAEVSLEPGYNFITNTAIHRGNTDDNGHGTLVSGIIAATSNNAKGIAGAAWKVRIMPIKALNAQGSGSSSDVSEAIVWAADHNAAIINMSLGGLGFGHDTTLANAIAHAYGKNTLIIAAAGNDVAVTGGNLDVNPVFPICDDNSDNMVLGVTATDANDVKPEFANFGKACIDVSAPGKRILSTINHDPTTGRVARNSYAYASGTSVAVPYVSAQAVLLKSLFPNATNQQLRDRIITTADKIDTANPTQCAGLSCAGLLGAGRINVAQSLAQQILPPVHDNDLVRVEGSLDLYYINGGKLRYVSPFVKNQRFPTAAVRTVSQAEIDQFPEGEYAEPLDGTLIRQSNELTVYYMSKGLRLPVTAQIFRLRNFNFVDVHALSYSEVNSWLLGSFLPPPEGSLVRGASTPTVYLTIGGVLHPVNRGFYVDMALEALPVNVVSESDLKSFPKGDPYIR